MRLLIPNYCINFLSNTNSDLYNSGCITLAFPLQYFETELGVSYCAKFLIIPLSISFPRELVTCPRQSSHTLQYAFFSGIFKTFMINPFKIIVNTIFEFVIFVEFRAFKIFIWVK